MFVPLTPLRCLDRAMDQFGGKTGVICGEKKFTFQAFGERCQRLATGLAKHGVAPGDRVAFLSFNTHKLLEGYYGVVQARAIVMPLNVRLSAPELIQILNHSGARMLCYEGDFGELVESLRPECPLVKTWVSLDGPHPLADTTYEAILADGHPEPADVFSFDENATAELFYTSGSTGTPKGVELTHRNLYLHALNIQCIVTDPNNVVDLHTIPLFHANGWGRPQLSTMLGFTQVMVRRFDPTTVFRLTQEHRATDMALVPTMANMLLNAADKGDYDLSSLKSLMLGGAAASPELVGRLEKTFQCKVQAGYGLTETSPVITSGRDKSTAVIADDAERQRRRAMAGWPVLGMKLRVVDIYGNEVPKDAKSIGEVVAQGDNIMAGYFKEKAATDGVLYDNWFHTGDMAVWDEQGYIHIVDRKKEIIISGGENISSIEVERAILAHDDVFECAVVSAPDEEWGEVPAAIVVRKPGTALDADQLTVFLKTRLGKFKLPRRIEMQDEPLPKTGTGKIRKLILKDRFWGDRDRRVQG